MKNVFKQMLVGLCCSLCAFASLQGAGWTPIVTIPDVNSVGENSQYTPSNSLLVTWTDSSDDLNAAFLSPLGVLSTPIVVASDADFAYSSVNPATGDAVVVWVNNTTNYALASIYTASSNTWGTPTTLDNTGTVGRLLQVSFSATGEAVACWDSYDIESEENFYNASTFSGGVWTGPVVLGIPSDVASLATPKNGAFAAAYWIDPTSSNDFEVYRFSAGTWNLIHSESLASFNLGSIHLIAIDNSGNIAVSLFYEDNMSVQQILGWGTGQMTATTISNNTGSSIHAFNGSLIVDNAGRAYVAWTAPTNSSSNAVHASNFLFAQPSGWSSDVNFNAPNIIVTRSLAADANGHLYVGLIDQTSASIVDESTYTASTSPLSSGSWSPLITLSDPTGFDGIGDVSVAANPSGVSLISWVQIDEDEGILAFQEVHKTATGDFTPFFTVTTASFGRGGTNSYVSDAGNKALSFFQPRERGGPILLTVYVDGVPPSEGPNPPTDFIGFGGKNKFLTQTERFNTLTWTASTTPTVVNYLLFRNGELIGMIPATGPLLFVDHNRNKHVADTYALYAVDASGAQSSAVIISTR